MRGWRLAAVLWAVAVVLALPGVALLLTAESDFLGFVLVTLGAMMFTMALLNVASEKASTHYTRE